MTRLNFCAITAARHFPPFCTKWPTRMPRSYALIAARALTASLRRLPSRLRELGRSRRLSRGLLFFLYAFRLAFYWQEMRAALRPPDSQCHFAELVRLRRFRHKPGKERQSAGVAGILEQETARDQRHRRSIGGECAEAVQIKEQGSVAGINGHRPSGSIAYQAVV